MRSFLPLIAVATSLMFALGCSSAGDKSSPEASTRAGAEATISSSADDSAAFTEPEPPEAAPAPTWFAVDATLSIVDGEGALVRVEHTYFDEYQQLLCEVSWAAEPLSALEVPPEEPILGWWEAQLIAPIPSGPCDATLPDAATSVFGVGAYDTRLDPARAALGLEEAHPLALYTEGSSGEIWLSGLAATEAQLAGVEEADSVVLQDGEYELVTLFLLPWAP